MAVGGRDEVLGDDALERRRELHAHLLLLRGGKGVDDAVDRLRRALGVKRREDEVTRLGGGERGRDRLEVAHLADEDHVGVLAQRGAKAFREGRRVLADLALVDDAALVVVEELDRVLDREDVLRARAVDAVDQRRERRRLARPGRARDEHEAARHVAELVEARRQSELLERPDPRRDHSEGRPDARALEVGVDAEPGDARQRVREVELALGLEELLLLGREDPVDRAAGCRPAGARRSPAALELPGDTDDGRRAHRKVEVGGVVLRDGGQELVDRKDRFTHAYSPFGVKRLRLERFLKDFCRGPSRSASTQARRTACRRDARARRAQPRSRTAALYGRSAVIASNASATRMMRDSSGISSPRSPCG